jgi:serine phosphatase RsbU (regulator of sigma subunit)
MGFGRIESATVHAVGAGVVVEVAVRGFAHHHSGLSGDWAGSSRQGGRVAAWVGDVAGSGPDAAEVADRLRASTAQLVADGADSSTLVRRLDVDVGRDWFATFVHCDVDPGTGRVSVLQLGHPPPLALAGGRFLHSGINPPLGYLGGGLQAPVAWVMPADETLLLFTDGLVERRTSSLTAGMETLRSATRELHGLEVGALADELLARLGADAEDDVTLLALRAGVVAPAPED